MVASGREVDAGAGDNGFDGRSSRGSGIAARLAE
jgi:hypothetical protein